MKVRFRTEAASDVMSAREWYDAQRPGLGDDFVAALEHVIDLVTELPEAFPEIAAGHRRPSARRRSVSAYSPHVG